ncbi:MAG TPA: tRNA pseudouridine(38-40) synthase TruA, partial [Pirellulaceae bacterium]|nr:tRNA pseudouridine(38-40) synthase TruA [Pirellulaceae bacterium]
FETGLEEITGVWTRVQGSSRTDRGVHALGQVVSFPTETRLDNYALRKALNAVLPFDMVVREIVDAPWGFNAIRDAVRKSYRYVVQDGRIRDPIARRHAWFVPKKLNVEAMQEAAQLFVGEHDFKAMQTSGAARESSVRTVHRVHVERRSMELGDQVTIEVEANGFLYNMVRNIAGTLVEVGKGNQQVPWVRHVLTSRDRRRAGQTAPAEALFLLWIKFPGDELA